MQWFVFSSLCNIFRKQPILPASGYAVSGSVDNADNEGNYWSSSLNEDNCHNAWNLNFNPDEANVDNNNRYNGFPVRGVFAGQGGKKFSCHLYFFLLYKVGYKDEAK